MASNKEPKDGKIRQIKLNLFPGREDYGPYQPRTSGRCVTAGASGGLGRSAPEEDGHTIQPRDLRPGMVVWNPYGGYRGRAVVASEPRERADGAVEFDTEDGRTGVFRPQFRLHLDTAATERLKNERSARAVEADPGHAMPGVTRDGRAARAAITDGRVTSLGEPKTGKAAADLQKEPG